MGTKRPRRSQVEALPLHALKLVLCSVTLSGAAPRDFATVVRVAVALREALPDDREQVEQLLADYLFEFDGRTEPYPYLDLYWEEPERLPFLIEADGEVVGSASFGDVTMVGASPSFRSSRVIAAVASATRR